MKESQILFLQFP